MCSIEKELSHKTNEIALFRCTLVVTLIDKTVTLITNSLANIVHNLGIYCKWFTFLLCYRPPIQYVLKSPVRATIINNSI